MTGWSASWPRKKRDCTGSRTGWCFTVSTEIIPPEPRGTAGETLAPLEQKRAAGHGEEAKAPGTADAGRKRIACRTAEMLRKRIALLQQPFRFSSMMRILFFDLSHLDCMTMQSLCGDLVCFLRKRF